MSTRNTTISGQHTTIARRTARTIRQCPVCRRDISLYADGTFYRHGPRGAECLGSHTEATDEQRAEITEIGVAIAGTVTADHPAIVAAMARKRGEQNTKQRPHGPVCGACGDDIDMCTAADAHHTVTEFDDVPTSDTVTRSACCDETISRPYSGQGEWTCDNCHGPADASPSDMSPTARALMKASAARDAAVQAAYDAEGTDCEAEMIAAEEAAEAAYRAACAAHRAARIANGDRSVTRPVV